MALSALPGHGGHPEPEAIQLPEPMSAGEKSVEEALRKRQSIRDFTRTPLTLPELSQLLWAAQNVSLQAVSLNLGAVVIGAFHDMEVKAILNLAEQEEPVYIIPVGRT